VLKPALARGEVQCIGATTLDEYRKYIEKDGALERRFQNILVNPPSKDEAVEILRGLRDRYEAHHRVRFTDEALFQAVEMSTRYITGRCLPDKAIDVMDEAGARVRLKNLTPPPDLTAWKRRSKSASVKRMSRYEMQTMSVLQPCETSARSLWRPRMKCTRNGTMKIANPRAWSTMRSSPKWSAV
jgi:ATP-dependent Clp protease ATP-binding subunit ClpA